MLKQKIKILVTCAGGILVRSLVQNLQRSTFFDYEVYGADTSKNILHPKGIFKKKFTVPNGNRSNYVEKIIQIAKRENIHVIWPGSDSEVFAISKNINKFKKYDIKIPISPKKTIQNLMDKERVYKILKKKHIRVPDYKICNNQDDVLNNLRFYGYPKKTVIIKPTQSRGGRDLIVAAGRGEKSRWLGRGKRETLVQNEKKLHSILKNRFHSKIMVMPKLNLPAYDVDILSDAGNAMTIITRKRINPNGIPFEGNKIIKNPRIESYCRKISRALNLDSLHDIDLMSYKNEEVLLEVNPRPSGSLAAALEAGFPIFDATIAKIFDRKIPVPKINKNISISPKKNYLLKIDR